MKPNEPKRLGSQKAFVLLMLIFLPLLCFGQPDHWIKCNKALWNYIEKPTHENSLKAYELLPHNLNGGSFPAGKTSDSIWLAAAKLDSMMLLGSRVALRIEFRLFTIADGEYAEGLDFTMGKLINKYPLLFLQELKNHRDLISRLGNLVCFIGLDYVDNAKLALIEIDNRIRSLSKINDAALINTRDECIKELKNHRKIFEEMEKEK